MDQNTTLPEKKTVAETLLTKGNVFLHLDPRKEGVVVPDWLKDQLQLVLQIGHDLPIRIPDLVIDDDGVSATLSFNRSPFTCWVPWDSLFAMVGDNGRGMVWMSDMPAEIAAEIEREVQKSRIKEVPDVARTDRKSKRSVKNKGLKKKDDAQETLPTEKSNGARTRKRRRVVAARIATGEVAPKTGKVGENSYASAKECRPVLSEKKTRDTTPPLNRGQRKRKTRELPPYLRVIK